MDCIDAQQIVSSALDHDNPPHDRLEEAKEHCRSCPQCSRLVRSLVAVQRTPLPAPPEDLTERIMAAVSAEAAETASAPDAPEVAASPAAPVAIAEPTEPPAANVHDLVARASHPGNRRAVIAWASVAAVVFIAAGFGAVAGVRWIASPETAMREVVLDSTAGLASGAAPEEQAAQAPQSAAGESTGKTDAGDGADTLGATAATASQGLIVVDGSVYRSTGEDPSVDPASLSEVGTTRSDLGGASESQWRVLGTDDPAHVFIEQQQGSVIAFERVTRSFEARTYVLQSGPIDGFSAGATLPGSVPEPSSPDGKPIFLPVADAGDQQVYVRTGMDATYGIALPPGAEPTLSQGWTWWSPAP